MSKTHELRGELSRIVDPQPPMDNPAFQAGFYREKSVQLERFAASLIDEIEHLQGEMEERINE